MNKIKLSGFTLLGLKLPQKTTNVGGQSSVDCGKLWQRFEMEDFLNQIPSKISDDIYAVYFDYEVDNQGFAYFIGCKVVPGTKAAGAMEELIIPEQKYIKVVARGKMPDCISNSWREIWNSNIERVYQYDMEIYDTRSKDWSNAEVDILVSSK